MKGEAETEEKKTGEVKTALDEMSLALDTDEDKRAENVFIADRVKAEVKFFNMPLSGDLIARFAFRAGVSWARKKWQP